VTDVGIGERLKWVRRSMATWILLLLVLLVVASLVGVSWTLGLFTSSSANPHNVVSSGSMHQVNSADNQAIMDAPDMVPGDSVEGSASIRNVGDARGDFTLTVEDLDDVPGPGGGVLSSRLRLQVTERGGNEPLYVGPLDALDADLGSWDPEEERSYDFVVTLAAGDATADNALQGSRTTVTFVWNAVQGR